MTINVGVVGLGKMGILHSGIVNFLPGAYVRAICERESFLVKVGRTLLPETDAFYKDHIEMVRNEEVARAKRTLGEFASLILYE